MKIKILVEHEIDTDIIENGRDYRSFCDDECKYLQLFNEDTRKCSLFEKSLDTLPNPEYTERCDKCLEYTPDVRRY